MKNKNLIQKSLYYLMFLLVILTPRNLIANPPTADLNSWKTPCFNCMNYALNLKTALFAQIPNPPPGGHTCASINAFVTATQANGGLGLTAAPAAIPPSLVPVCPPGQCIVALSFGTAGGALAGDFHWYRRNADGSWSQKHGEGDATNLDDATPGVPMTDANPPGGGANLGDYTFCGYYCIPVAPNLLANPAVSDPGHNEWTVALNTIRIFRHILSGLTLHFFDIFLGTLDENLLIAKLPNTSSQVPNPQWSPTERDRGYGIMPGAPSSSIPAYIKVHNGVVAYYSDLDGTNISYYADNNGLEAYLASKFPSSSNFIPTISQWGLFILILLSLAMGMVYISKRQRALAFAGNTEDSSSGRNIPFNKTIYLKTYAVILGLAIVALGLSFAYFGSVTKIDALGTVISSAIIAYMAHLFILKKK